MKRRVGTVRNGMVFDGKKWIPELEWVNPESITKSVLGDLIETLGNTKIRCSLEGKKFQFRRGRESVKIDASGSREVEHLLSRLWSKEEAAITPEAETEAWGIIRKIARRGRAG